MNNEKHISNLQTIREEYNDIASAWNGSDDYFYAQGERYHEDDAHLASDIVDECDSLIGLLEDFDF